MKALILIQRDHGKEVEISQWCNDWFSDVDGRIHLASSLAFTEKDFNSIRADSNNGMLFTWFSPYHLKDPILVPCGDEEIEYKVIFRRASLLKTA